MRLSRRWNYTGKAWYQRDIDIPAAWNSKPVSLLLERTKATRVWIDDREAGSLQVRLMVPHVYDLTGLATPGLHRLTILVDSGYPFPVSGHALSPDTQTNWNGIIGRIELTATDPVWIERIKATPDVRRKSVTLAIEVRNATGKEVSGTIRVNSISRPVTITGESQTIQLELPVAATWDEFDPVLLPVSAILQTPAGSDRRTLEVGLRQFGREGTQFAVNGKRTFLRGKHEGAVFPLTGYPPTSVDAWLRYFRTLKSYGMNHVRFHSWTPPEAAFTAADREGFYLLAENPMWGPLPDPKVPEKAAFMRDEAFAILDAYANHPSFCMFTPGNELSGDREVLSAFVAELRAHDPRPLYATGTNAFFNEPMQTPGDDFWVTMRTRQGESGRTRAAFSHADLPLGHIETGPPGTNNDYSRALAGVTVPVVGHEVGQFQVFPDFDETRKYTGVLEARNFTELRKGFEKSGMFNQRRDFFRASGALSVLCYREEVEAALRTPGFGGFELLDLQDYPGQGTALVGILDAFLDSKGLITPEHWREFCSRTVPLLRTKKYTWTRGETFHAQIQLAHYGARDLNSAVIEWSIAGGPSGALPPRKIAQGTLGNIGNLDIPLQGLRAPARYDITLRLAGTAIRNSYPIWVYPDHVETRAPQSVTMARSLTPEIQAKLNAGGRVLLIPEPADLRETLGGLFMTDFWCFPMFEQIAKNMKTEVSPGTMGILTNPQHPALAQFPSEFHTNWQWWHLIRNSRAVILDQTPASYRPVVQVVDNVFRNHKLGLVFETRYGSGRLLICSIDLLALQERPEARQLLASLLAYAASNSFNPSATLDPALFIR